MDDKQKESNEQGGQGRINTPGGESSQQQSARQQADISAVDQQEGDMNNGELGGNFEHVSGNAQGEKGK